MFRAVKALLPDALRRMGLRPQVNAAQVIAATNELLGPSGGAPRPRAIRYQDGEILIAVRHPAEASLLRHGEMRLFTSLRQRFPTLVFRRLRFTTRP